MPDPRRERPPRPADLPVRGSWSVSPRVPPGGLALQGAGCSKRCSSSPSNGRLSKIFNT
ncbi:hypothetical protein HBB16_09765 [Pseudonocardia sp. MCCB 268]|nr:hypothetical protein [Pseudonocardia cytotoxica]